MEIPNNLFQYGKTKQKKTNITGSATSEVYVSSWYAFKALSFLGDISEPRATVESPSCSPLVPDAGTYKTTIRRLAARRRGLGDRRRQRVAAGLIGGWLKNRVTAPTPVTSEDATAAPSASPVPVMTGGATAARGFRDCKIIDMRLGF
ncbi:hypothetical protein LOC100571047 [Anopheles sinensis]|uniref:Uncharacterized protein n=1 Tax=Anopheles sinensis TaxID=74873 RepID=A0A084VZG5_ANOSI|nr:hypothetical protein LOC100571047 [Anopheles sinensis]